MRGSIFGINRVVALVLAIAVSVILLAIIAEQILAAGDAAGCNTILQRIFSQLADKAGTGFGIC